MIVNNARMHIESYLKSDSVYPFFLVVGDDYYITVQEDLSALGFDIVGLSSYCGSPDREPNMGTFMDELKNGGNKAIIGLGEYLAIKGEQTTLDTLSYLKNPDKPLLDRNKIVLLLRGVTDAVVKLKKDDSTRFNETQNRVAFIGDCKSQLSLTCVSGALNLADSYNGLKNILGAFENGNNYIVATTKNRLINSLIEVHNIPTAYDGIKYLMPSFEIDSEFGNDEQWEALFVSLNDAKGDIEEIFANIGMQSELMADFNKYIQRNTFASWLYYIALKLKIDTLDNSYLQYILEQGTKYEDFKSAVLNAIINIKHADKRFNQFYDERAELVKKFSPHEVLDFVENNKIDPAEELYKLTAQTEAEREELIALFSSLNKETVHKRVESVYLDLADYLRSYTFIDAKVSAKLRDLLTDYFNRYKWQKLQNHIDDDFITMVEDLANRREYNFLPSRNDILGGIDKADTFLYWLDALGVEFLGFIQSVCTRLSLKLTIHIGRAELPTITCENRDFYDEWEKRDKKSCYHNLDLDEVKHKEKGGYNYENKKLPIHLMRELEILAEVLDEISRKLVKGDYKKYLLVSDHGASRLAVIKEQEEKYETDTKGEHSGRCCKTPANYEYDLPFAAEEGEYLVLANYGRFKNSRKANVEVHGGASLEEVIVPVIEITLADQNIQISLVDDVVAVDYKTSVVLTLFSKTKLNNVKVVIDGKPYPAIKSDDKHYKVVTDINKARKYNVDVYDGDMFIGKMQFTAEGKNKSNSDFDSDFDF